MTTVFWWCKEPLVRSRFLKGARTGEQQGTSVASVTEEVTVLGECLYVSYQSTISSRDNFVSIAYEYDCIQTKIHTNKHTHTHTHIISRQTQNIQAHTHTNIHKYINAHTHTDTHTEQKNGSAGNKDSKHKDRQVVSQQ